jgi:ATP-dependent protease ClpP protease subunit
MKLLTVLCLAVVIVFSSISSSSQATSSINKNRNPMIVMNPFGNPIYEKLAIDPKTGTIHMGVIDLHILETLQTALMYLNQAGHKTITIDLHSPGGNVLAMDIIGGMFDDFRKQTGSKINTRVSKNNACMSACTIIFTYGDLRIAHESSTFMFHSPRIDLGEMGKKIPSLQKHFDKSVEDMQLQFVEIYTKFCGISPINDIVISHQDGFIRADALKDMCHTYITHLAN